MEEQPKKRRHENLAANLKVKRFVREYLKDFNATQAAIRAGYAPSGARSRASKLLSNVVVTREINKLIAKINSAAEVSVETTVRKLNRVANFDPASLFDAQGRLLPIHSIDTDSRLALTGLRISRTTTNDPDKGAIVTETVSFGGKMAAILALAKHLAMYTRRVAELDPEDDWIRKADILRLCDEGNDGDYEDDSVPQDPEDSDDEIDLEAPDRATSETPAQKTAKD